MSCRRTQHSFLSCSMGNVCAGPVLKAYLKAYRGSSCSSPMRHTERRSSNGCLLSAQVSELKSYIQVCAWQAGSMSSLVFLNSAACWSAPTASKASPGRNYMTDTHAALAIEAASGLLTDACWCMCCNTCSAFSSNTRLRQLLSVLLAPSTHAVSMPDQHTCMGVT